MEIEIQKEKKKLYFVKLLDLFQMLHQKFQYFWNCHVSTVVLSSQVLLFYDQSYRIHYEYTMSLNTTQLSSSPTPRKPGFLYIWTHSNWQDCSAPCGRGKKLLNCEGLSLVVAKPVFVFM